MASGLNDLLTRIEKLKESVKKRYPEKGKVLIANAETNVNYSFPDSDKINEMEWSHRFLDELNKCL